MRNKHKIVMAAACLLFGGCMKKKTESVAKEETKTSYIQVVDTSEKMMSALEESGVELGYGEMSYHFDVPEGTKKVVVTALHMQDAEWVETASLVLEDVKQEGTLVLVNGENHALTMYAEYTNDEGAQTALQACDAFPLNKLTSSSFVFLQGKEQIVLNNDLPVYLERYYPPHISAEKNLEGFFDTDRFKEDDLTIGVTVRFE